MGIGARARARALRDDRPRRPHQAHARGGPGRAQPHLRRPRVRHPARDQARGPRRDRRGLPVHDLQPERGAGRPAPPDRGEARGRERHCRPAGRHHRHRRHQGRHRPRDLGLPRSGRRGAASHPGLGHLRRSDPARGSGARQRAAPQGSRPDAGGRRPRGTDHSAHAGDPAQHAPQSHRPGVRLRRAGGDRPGRPAPRSPRARGRDPRVPRLHERAAPEHRGPARHGRAHPHVQRLLQGVLDGGLAGRLRARRPRARREHAEGAPAPRDLRQRGGPEGRGGGLRHPGGR